MKYTIRLFAGLADTIGHTHITLTSEQTQISVEQLKQLIIQQYPFAEHIVTLSFIAKNQAYATLDEFISEEDELALIPPVSGGEAKSLEPSATEVNSLYQIIHEAISV
jgi:MoaE-MoaD fusion protein